MTEEAKNLAPSTIKFVKNTVELIYGLTSDGGVYRGGFKNETTRFRRIASILVKRGSLIKEGSQRNLTYRWNPVAMAPTKVFITSIASELVEENRRHQRKSYHKKKVAEGKPLPGDLQKASLDYFTIQQLWDELKRRGCSIEDNQLVLVKREVFE